MYNCPLRTDCHFFPTVYPNRSIDPDVLLTWSSSCCGGCDLGLHWGWKHIDISAAQCKQVKEKDCCHLDQCLQCHFHSWLVLAEKHWGPPVAAIWLIVCEWTDNPLSYIAVSFRHWQGLSLKKTIIGNIIVSKRVGNVMNMVWTWTFDVGGNVKRFGAGVLAIYEWHLWAVKVRNKLSLGPCWAVSFTILVLLFMCKTAHYSISIVRW